jgi:hypothetical protein
MRHLAHIFEAKGDATCRQTVGALVRVIESTNDHFTRRRISATRRDHHEGKDASQPDMRR